MSDVLKGIASDPEKLLDSYNEEVTIFETCDEPLVSDVSEWLERTHCQGNY